jgi:MEMO1 family protein
MEAALISTSAATRPAAVAGLFYPAAPDALRADVRRFLAAAPRVAVGRPKILVVPHAGYVYSGATAASGYAALGPWSESIRRVVLIGPSHRVPIEGIAVPAAFRFATPLGPVELDRDAIDALRALPQVVQSDRAHSAEHALEVQLPFLQQVLGTFALIPLAVGDATTEEVADLLECAWGGDETLVVVSSDLSHYLSYERAREVDRVTLHQVLELGPELDHVQACGATPLNAAMLVARRHGLVPRLLAACNSGDTAGDRDRVVGYAALAFSAPVAAKESADCVGEQTTAGVVAPGTTATTATTATTLPGGEILLAHARHAIERLFASGSAAASPPYASFLDRPGATFVTLRWHGQLRGCIGSLEPDRPLHVDVAHNARAAALHDPRFSPLTADELDGLTVEVSLLSPPEPIIFGSEDDVVRQLDAARDGVLLEYRSHRSTFLPQVWEQVDDASEFLRQLKVKAGLAAGFWSAGIRIARYSVQKWSEQG